MCFYAEFKVRGAACIIHNTNGQQAGMSSLDKRHLTAKCLGLHFFQLVGLRIVEHTVCLCFYHNIVLQTMPTELFAVQSNACCCHQSRCVVLLEGTANQQWQKSAALIDAHYCSGSPACQPWRCFDTLCFRGLPKAPSILL